MIVLSITVITSNWYAHTKKHIRTRAKNIGNVVRFFVLPQNFPKVSASLFTTTIWYRKSVYCMQKEGGEWWKRKNILNTWQQIKRNNVKSLVYTFYGILMYERKKHNNLDSLSFFKCDSINHFILGKWMLLNTNYVT